MDFEASGFGPDGYPIEVGYCLGNGKKYCTLIQPAESWRYWDNTAEQLHGISRANLLDAGTPIREVALTLNENLQGLVLYSDGWAVDERWLNQLFAIAGVARSFQLRAIEHIQSECQYLCWDNVRSSLLAECTMQRHRASSDAEFVQQVYQATRMQCQAVESELV